MSKRKEGQLTEAALRAELDILYDAVCIGMPQTDDRSRFERIRDVFDELQIELGKAKESKIPTKTEDDLYITLAACQDELKSVLDHVAALRCRMRMAFKMLSRGASKAKLLEFLEVKD